MTVGILKQDPNIWKVQNNAIYSDKTQHAIFGGNPLYQATKWHLNNNQMVKNYEKYDGELIHLSFWGWTMSSQILDIVIVDQT